MSDKEFAQNIPRRCKIKLLGSDGNYSLQFMVESGQMTIIGRSDDLIAFYPVVDLSGYGAYSSGVSRTHAILELIDDQLYVTDKSTNGTRINGERLPEDKPCPVDNHSMLAFGDLTFYVMIQSFNTDQLDDMDITIDAAVTYSEASSS